MGRTDSGLLVSCCRRDCTNQWTIGRDSKTLHKCLSDIEFGVELTESLQDFLFENPPG